MLSTLNVSYEIQLNENKAASNVSYVDTELISNSEVYEAPVLFHETGAISVGACKQRVIRDRGCIRLALQASL